MLLDGGLATQLEAQGADLVTTLWSAQLLIDDPAAVIAAHRAFFAAGARIAITASYQAPTELASRSVDLAREALAEFDDDRASLGGRLGRALRRSPGRRLGVPRRLRPLGRGAAGLAPAADRGAG